MGRAGDDERQRAGRRRVVDLRRAGLGGVAQRRRLRRRSARRRPTATSCARRWRRERLPLLRTLALGITGGCADLEPGHDRRVGVLRQPGLRRARPRSSALDATLRLRGPDGAREVPAGEFFLGAVPRRRRDPASSSPRSSCGSDRGDGLLQVQALASRAGRSSPRPTSETDARRPRRPRRCRGRAGRGASRSPPAPTSPRAADDGSHGRRGRDVLATASTAGASPASSPSARDRPGPRPGGHA